MAILTDTKARNIKPDEKAIPHGGVVGLALHSSKTKGRGKWVLRYVSPVSGKRRNAGLGSYPEVSIADAARLATGMREQLAKGLDPLDERKMASVSTENAVSVPMFEEAARLLHQELLPSWKNFKHGQQWINTLVQYVFPVLGSIRLDCIDPKLLAEVLRPIWLDKAETASRVKQRIHAVMAWGWAQGFCSSNPIDVVHFLLPKQPSKAARTEHQPTMPWRDIPLFIADHLHNNDRYDVTRAILEFLILTAVRSGEVREMRWEEVDIKKAVWTIPAERMKAGIEHRVPLSIRCIAILNRVKGLDEVLVFPSPRKNTVMSDMALTQLLRRLNAHSDTADRIATAHGFRSSFRDWCSENGYARDLAERALAHTVQNKVEAAYHRTDLLEQRRPMMETWAEFCLGNLNKQ